MVAQQKQMLSNSDNSHKSKQGVEHYHQLRICSTATLQHHVQAREEASSSGMLERPPEKRYTEKISVKITFGKRERRVEKTKNCKEGQSLGKS